MSFDSTSFRKALGLFVTGVTVITTRTAEGEPVGVTANSFNSVSMTPPLILWSLGRASRSLEAFETTDHFAVHILRSDQRDISNQFARSGADKFEGVPYVTGQSGIPLLTDCAARFECSVYDRHDGGDHIIFIGEVLSILSDHDAAPLLYHGGRYAALTDLAED